MNMRQREFAQGINCSTFERYGYSRKPIKKLLEQDTLATDWYKTFTTIPYGSLKNYVQYEAVAFKLSEFLTMMALGEFQGFHLEKDMGRTFTALIINQAYHLGFRPMWLSKSLSQAFSYSQLPKKISALNRICPVGLLFFPSSIKNEKGHYLKWAMFYHKLPGEFFFSA